MRSEREFYVQLRINNNNKKENNFVIFFRLRRQFTETLCVTSPPVKKHLKYCRMVCVCGVLLFKWILTCYLFESCVIIAYL